MPVGSQWRLQQRRTYVQGFPHLKANIYINVTLGRERTSLWMPTISRPPFLWAWCLLEMGPPASAVILCERLCEAGPFFQLPEMHFCRFTCSILEIKICLFAGTLIPWLFSSRSGLRRPSKGLGKVETSPATRKMDHNRFFWKVRVEYIVRSVVD